MWGEAVAAGVVDLPKLAAHLGSSHSTPCRLVATLVELRYPDFVQRVDIA